MLRPVNRRRRIAIAVSNNGMLISTKGTPSVNVVAVLDDACVKLQSYGPDVVLISLGVDTFEKDPISKFKLKSEHYPKIGARIGRLGLPTLFVMEGGYAVAEIGVNAVGVLTGFEGG